MQKTKINRDTILENLRAEIAAGRPIIGSGAGVGLIGRIVDRAGIDLIVVYNSGHFRMNGYSSILGNLPVGDANAMVLEMGEELIINAVRRAPVVGGIFGVDPTRDMRRFLERMADVGYSGVINYPTVGKMNGRLRYELEHVGLGLDREIATMRMAADMGFLTLAYVFCPEDARRYAAAGADVLVSHAGLTQGGDIGLQSDGTLEESMEKTEAILRAGLEENPGIIPLCHGGAIISPDDARAVFRQTSAVGFIGASSIERIPGEQIVSRTVESFKSLPLDEAADPA